MFSSSLRHYHFSIRGVVPYLLLTVLIACTATEGIGQDAGQSFTEEQFQRFARVYLAQMSIETVPDSLIQLTLQEAAMSPQRYGEILRAGLEGRKVSLSKSEQEVFSTLSKLESDFAKYREERLMGICIDEGIPWSIYRLMEEKFGSEVGFQRRLKPYFDEIIQRHWEDGKE